MNKLPLLFLGIFATFASAWVGLVAVPHFQYGHLQPHVDEETGDQFPPTPTGLAVTGRQVYQANGCIYCHSQQIRPENAATDIRRGWGLRRSVPRDYIYDKPHLMGTMRTGPDLTNIGRRQTSLKWHLQHLYEPTSLVKESIMPPFRHLFEKRRIVGAPSPDALELEGAFAPPAGYEVVPRQEAIALAHYLLSLRQDYALPEAPMP